MAKPQFPDMTTPSTINWGWLKTVLTNRIPALMSILNLSMKDDGSWTDERMGPKDEMESIQFNETALTSGGKKFSIKPELLGGGSTTWAQLQALLEARPGYNPNNKAGIIIDGEFKWVEKPTGGTSGTPQLSTPTNVAVSNITQTGVTLTWSSVTNATGYVVEMRTKVNGIFGAWSQKVVVGNTLTTNITDLVAGTDYEFRVYATASGYTVSPYSVSSSLTTLASGAPVGDTVVPLSSAADWFSLSAFVLEGDDLVHDVTTGNGMAVSTRGWNDGATGYVQCSWPVVATGAITHAHLRLGEGTGAQNWQYDVGVYYTASGTLLIRTNGNAAGDYLTDSFDFDQQSGVTKAYARIRLTATHIVFDRSVDGITWVPMNNSANGSLIQIPRAAKRYNVRAFSEQTPAGQRVNDIATLNAS